MAIDYKEKIKKLLALAESPNENEAKAALLKARQLMAEHKLREEDCSEFHEREVKDVLTDITCSTRREPWITLLSVVIATNYCCKSYRTHVLGKQTLYIGFIGLSDDVEICEAVFRYAVDCIRTEIQNIKKTMQHYSKRFVTQECDGYGYGFAVGIKDAFEEQNEEEWGLVLVLPKEVVDATQDLKPKPFKLRDGYKISEDSFRKGHLEGKNFDPTRKLQE